MLYGATSDGNDRLFYFVVDDSNVDGDLPYNATSNAVLANLIVANSMTVKSSVFVLSIRATSANSMRTDSSPAGSLAYRRAGADSSTPNATLGLIWAM